MAMALNVFSQGELAELAFQKSTSHLQGGSAEPLAVFNKPYKQAVAQIAPPDVPLNPTKSYFW